MINSVSECWRWRFSVSGTRLASAGTVTLVWTSDRTFPDNQRSQRKTGARQSWWMRWGGTEVAVEGPLHLSEGRKTRMFKRQIGTWTFVTLNCPYFIWKWLWGWHFLPGEEMHSGGWTAAAGVCCCPLLPGRTNWHFPSLVWASRCAAWKTGCAGRAARGTHSPGGWRESVTTNEAAAANNTYSNETMRLAHEHIYIYIDIPSMIWNIQRCVNEEECPVCFPYSQTSIILRHSDRKKKHLEWVKSLQKLLEQLFLKWCHSPRFRQRETFSPHLDECGKGARQSSNSPGHAVFWTVPSADPPDVILI